jgi:hypothetical protein
MRATSVTSASRDLDRINYVNVGLMVAAGAAASVLPFEVFLASYAVLGPLHYLTQISWLHDRGYFTTGRFDWIPLALLGALALEASYGHWLAGSARRSRPSASAWPPPSCGTRSSRSRPW